MRFRLSQDKWIDPSFTICILDLDLGNLDLDHSAIMSSFNQDHSHQVIYFKGCSIQHRLPRYRRGASSPLLGEAPKTLRRIWTFQVPHQDVGRSKGLLPLSPTNGNGWWIIYESGEGLFGTWKRALSSSAEARLNLIPGWTDDVGRWEMSSQFCLWRIIGILYLSKSRGPLLLQGTSLVRALSW